MHPFTSEPGQRLDAWGETRLLREMRTWLGDVAPPSPYGMGDDAAVLSQPSNVFKTDSLVYGRHFDDQATPAQAGAKLLKRNLSDLAAMGALPQSAVLAGFLPPDLALSWLESFTRGLAACARRHGVALVGGDLTATPGFLGFSLALLGEAPHPLLRGTAAAGDTLYVTGALGGSILGHHLTFEPRLPEGQWLAQRDDVTALMDLTDGLAKDLPALLGPHLAVALDLDRLPISPAAHQVAASSGRTARAHALTDGEDYELLFTLAHASNAPVFERAWTAAGLAPLSRLGTLIPRPAPQVALVDAATGAPLDLGLGYEHFRGA